MIAVHNIHAPPVETVGSTYTLDGTVRIYAGEPLATFETMAEALEWARAEREKHNGNL